MVMPRISAKKILFILLFVGILGIFAAIFIAGKTQTPYDCLKKETKNWPIEPSELLYQETLDTGFDIVFYTDRRGLFNCGLTKKGLFGYRMVNISGSLGIYDDTYHYSSFADGQTRNNICWGVLTDNDVTEVLLDNESCNITNTAYNFRFFWLMGLEIDDPSSPLLPSLTKNL